MNVKLSNVVFLFHTDKGLHLVKMVPNGVETIVTIIHVDSSKESSFVEFRQITHSVYNAQLILENFLKG